jgi:hypothetical protein
MICELIMISSIAINPCDVKALERPYTESRKHTHCTMLTDTGRRHSIAMPCGKVYEVLKNE